MTLQDGVEGLKSRPVTIGMILLIFSILANTAVIFWRGGQLEQTVGDNQEGVTENQKDIRVLESQTIGLDYRLRSQEVAAQTLQQDIREIKQKLEEIQIDLRALEVGNALDRNQR